MTKNVLRLIKTIMATLFTSIFFVSCSKNIENLPVNEQAIQKSSRFSSDKDKDSYRKPLDVLNFLSIKPDAQIIDLLGGGGYYSELFSHIVGENGKVYLQNNSLFLRFSEKELTKRLAKNRLPNVVRLDSEFSDMQLPSNTDIIFMGLSFHDIYVERDDPVIMAEPASFFQQIRSALKPGGHLIVIDHAARIGSKNNLTSQLHRIDEEWTKAEIISQGFEFTGSSDVLRNTSDNYDLDIWKKEVFHKTDRFIYTFKKIDLQH